MKRFEAELVRGHKGVVVVRVPFDPEVVFGRKPTRLAGRRHGWPLRGKVAGVAFDGYVGERWGRFFVELEEDVRDAAGVAVGDVVVVAVTPSDEPSVVGAAVEQSKRTTQPTKARGDAVECAGLRPGPHPRARQRRRPRAPPERSPREA